MSGDQDLGEHVPGLLGRTADFVVAIHADVPGGGPAAQVRLAISALASSDATQRTAVRLSPKPPTARHDEWH